MTVRRAHTRQFDSRIEPANRLDPPRVLAELVQHAGVRFNGDCAWDIQVHDANLYSRVLLNGSLGFGESYMAGEWDCHAMDELFDRLLSADVEDKVGGWARLRLLAEVLRQRLFNKQSEARAFQVGQHHYDIGNDVFEAMLDPTMSYSCAHWAGADSLDQA